MPVCCTREPRKRGGMGLTGICKQTACAGRSPKSGGANPPVSSLLSSTFEVCAPPVAQPCFPGARRARATRHCARARVVSGRRRLRAAAAASVPPSTSLQEKVGPTWATSADDERHGRGAAPLTHAETRVLCCPVRVPISACHLRLPSPPALSASPLRRPSDCLSARLPWAPACRRWPTPSHDGWHRWHK